MIDQPVRAGFAIPPRSTRMDAGSPAVKPVIRPLRWLLYLGAVLALIAGIQLVILARHTDEYFAWTVKPALSAAALGAFFWAAAVFGLLSARQRAWANARLALPAGVAFSAMTLAATLIHVDRFHLTSLPPLTRLPAYFWLAVHALGLPLLLVAQYLQVRAAGGNPPPSAALPRIFRVLLGLQSAIAFLIGATLFLEPGAVIPLWGWVLTPLTARALGAWLVPLGVVGAQAVWEDDWARLRAAMIGCTILAALQLIVFGIYSQDVLFENPFALAWVAYWLLVALMAGYGAIESLRVSRWGTRQEQANEAA